MKNKFKPARARMKEKRILMKNELMNERLIDEARKNDFITN